MTGSNLAHRHYASREGFAPVYRPSVPVRVRVQNEIESARRLIPRGVKLVGVLSPQDFSACRKHPSGGFVGKMIALVVMRPDIGYLLIAHMQSALRRTACRTTRPLRIVRAEKVAADAAEDVARNELQDNESIETLRRAIAAQEEEVARGQALLDEYRERLAELEAGR